MPELPEVETVRRRLLTCLPGLLLREVVVNDWTVSVQTEQELNEYLAGRRVTGLRRRGKYLLVDFGAVDGPPGGASGPDDEGFAGTSVAVIHLRMTGQLVFRPEPGARPARFLWNLEPATTLHFQDVRRFGRLWALEPAAEDDFFASRGWAPSPSVRSSRSSICAARYATACAPLKAFLLDQRRIAGVGNIYADEALFRARLHPLRAAGSVGPREARRLHAALLETLQAGIDHEGSSIESFIDPAGQRGSFQEILNVYQRTGEPCRVCGTIVERTVVGGRGTHYCPRCQPRRGGMAPGSRGRLGGPVPPRSAKPADWEAPDW